MRLNGLIQLLAAAFLPLRHGRTLLACSAALSLASCIEPDPAPPSAAPFLSSNTFSELGYDVSVATLNVKGIINSPVATPLTSINFHTDSNCTDTPVGRGILKDFSTDGIQVRVPSSGVTTLFFMTNTEDGCHFFAEYNPLHLPPEPPRLISTSPTSPSHVSYTPVIFGTTSPTTSFLRFYDDLECTNEVGSGTPTDYSTGGILLSLRPSATNKIYAKAFEAFGGSSACMLLTTYTHSSLEPSVPTLKSLSPLSPNNLSTSPALIGQVDAITATISFFSDPGCATSIGSGTAADFQGEGISIVVQPNSITTIWAQAYGQDEHPSACSYLTTYTHETTAPLPPIYNSMNPGTRTRLTTFPRVIGSAPNNPASTLPISRIGLFSDSRCLEPIGQGTKTQFTTSGVTATALRNATISIYAKSFDAAGNYSPCTYLSDFMNNEIPPDPPVFTTTNPISPNNKSVTPLVIGGAASLSPLPAVIVTLYSDEQCSTQIGSGSASEFEDRGIRVVVQEDATTQIFAASFDELGNKSDCALMANYMESTRVPPGPVIVSTNPPSPSNYSTNPYIIGSASPIISNVQIFSDNQCTKLIGSGPRLGFNTGGIRVTVPSEAATPLYSIGTDIYGNVSSCTYLTTYIHTATKPYPPAFRSYTPASPNNLTDSPVITGVATNNPNGVLPTSKIVFYDSSVCVNRVGTGSASQFSADGITLKVPLNSATDVHAKSYDDAGNYSACTRMAEYTIDKLPPGKPRLIATSPATPSYSQFAKVTGYLSANDDILPPATVTIYSDPTCINMLGSANVDVFTSTGIPITVFRNSTTSLFGQTTNIVGNVSACNNLLDFVHNDNAPEGLIAQPLRNGGIEVMWKADTRARPTPTYIVKRSLRSNGPYTIVGMGLRDTLFTDRSVNTGATYYYVVASTNSTGTSVDSGEAVATSIPVTPTAPTSLVATPSNAQIKLTWNTDGSAVYYHLYRALVSGGPYSLIAAKLTESVYVDSTVSNNIPYYYVIAASNPSGTSPYSNEASAVAKPLPPAPTNLSVVQSGNCVQLNWSAPAYHEGFAVFRGPYSGQELSRTDVGNATSYQYCTLTKTAPSGAPINFNYFVVKALWARDTSEPSNEVAFNPNTAPSLSASAGNGEVSLRWTNASGADSFVVYRSSSLSGPFTAIATTADLFYNDTVTNGQSYQYWVQPFYAGSLGFASNQVGAIPGAKPSAPSNLILTVQQNNPLLSWSAPANYSSFNVYRATASAGPYQLLQNVQTNFLLDQPGSGIFYYKVTAVWGNDETAASNVVSFRNAIVTGLAATPVSSPSSKVTLSWTAYSGATNYAVYRATKSGGPYTILSSTAATPYSDTAVTNGVGYFYAVAPNFSDGSRGQKSSEVSAMTGSAVIPSGLTVASTGASFISLSWAKVSTATGYNIYYSTSASGPWSVVRISTATPQGAATGLTAGTTYYFTVTSLVNAAESAKSAQITAVTIASPAAPSVTPGNQCVDLSWSPVSGASTYVVQRSTDGVNFSDIASGLTTIKNTDGTCGGPGLTNGQAYFYRITAVANGFSVSSPNSVLVTPGITPFTPQGLSVQLNNTGTDLLLGWTPVSGATGYNLYQALQSGGPYTLITPNTLSEVNNAISALTAGTTYYFVVSALNGAMESARSQELAVVPRAEPPAPTVQINSSGSAVLSWPTLGSETSYSLFRSTNGESFDPIATGVSGNTYTDSSITPQVQYYYRYQLYYGSAESSVSASSSPVTAGTRPVAPTNLWAVSTTTPSAILNWTPSLNIVGYKVYRSPSAGGPYSSLGTVSDPASIYADATVTVGSTYYYVVTAVNASGVESVFSNEVGMDFTTVPTGLSAAASNGVIHLRWNATPGATGHLVQRSTSPTGPYTLIATGLGALEYFDQDIENGVTYYYVVNASYPSGIISKNSTQVSSTAIAVMNLQIPVELTDAGLASNQEKTIFERTRTSINPAAYDGTVTYFWEIVAVNTDSSAHVVELVDSAANVRGSLNVPASTMVPTRIRGVFSPGSAWDSYRVSLDATPSNQQLEVESARILINQLGASKTRVYIPLLSSSAFPSNADQGGAVESTTAMSYSDLNSAMAYRRNTSALSHLAEYNAWELETVVSAAPGTIGTVVLNNATRSRYLVETESYFEGSEMFLINAPFNDGIQDFDSRNEGEQYQISISCWSGCKSGTVSLYKAGLWVNLTRLSQVEIPYRIALGENSVSSSSSFATERTLLDLSAFTNPTVFFEAQAKVASASVTASIDLLDLGTADSTFTTSAAVSSSGLNFSSVDRTWIRSPALTVTGGNRYGVSVAPSGGTAALTSASLIINAVR